MPSDSDRIPSAANPSRRCRGVLGLMFGHKFSKVGVLTQEGYCYRCGMPKGGWSRAY